MNKKCIQKYHSKWLRVLSGQGYVQFMYSQCRVTSG